VVFLVDTLGGHFSGKGKSAKIRLSSGATLSEAPVGGRLVYSERGGIRDETDAKATYNGL